MATDKYEEDEFDRAAATQPAGAHRQPVSRLKLAWPFLAAIILAPLLAWGAVTLFFGNSTAKEATPSPTATETAQETQSPTTDPTAERGKTPVTVYNAVGVQGLAGRAAEKLKAEGFTNVNPTNAAARGITASTVYYARPSMKAAAEDAAKILGIAAVTEKPQNFQMPDGVVVYLLKDYTQK